MMVEHAGIETSNSTMEKLELLSATAALKQGIDGNNNSNGYSSRSNSNHCGEKVLVLDNSNRVVDGNLPSPVSIEDNETETDDGTMATNVNIATKTNVLGENNSIHNNLGRTISRNSIRSNPHVRGDIRSPVPTPTVEYRQIDAVAAAAQSSPLPFPFLPRQTTHHNHHLNHRHQQQQHDYAPSSYIVRSLSEASPVYGGNNNSNNSIPISSSHHHAAAVMSTSAVTNNSSEYDTNLHLQQQQHQHHHQQQQQQPPPPSHLRLSIQQQHHHQQQLQQQQLSQHRRPSSQLSSAPSRSRSPTYEDMARQIQNMQEQLGEKDMVVSSLQHRVNYLENQIHELRQLPTGKISHIPVE
jgi:hypothetical protein